MSFVSVSRPQRSPFFCNSWRHGWAAWCCSWWVLERSAVDINCFLQSGFFRGFTCPVWISSLTKEQASAALSQHITYPTSGRIVFRDGERVWVATPVELGMVFDAGTSVQHAYELGRQGGILGDIAIQLNSWQDGMYLPPVILFDARVAHEYIKNIARQFDQPVVEANLELNGSDVVYKPGQIGRVVNVDKTLAALVGQLKTFQDGEVPVIIEEQSPIILDASAQANILRQALSAPMTLHIANSQNDDPGPGRLIHPFWWA